MSNSSGGNACKSFEAHNLRQEKCRNCFMEKSHHPVDNSVAAKQATGESKQTENNESMSKEQLIFELKKCNDEKGELCKELANFAEKDEQICKYKREIEKLKLEIRKSSKASLVREEEMNEASISAARNDVQGKAKIDLQQQQLEDLKQRCQKLEIERDNALEELKTLEKEMEEMHDNFREDESEQFEQVKQELDLATKNCKILQIRLNKCERQYNQLEQVKSMLERQLEEASRQQEQNPDKHFEQQQQNYFTQISQDSVKLSTNEYDQLLRDLNDTIEREKDLQEQIKYSQEEAQLKGDRLQAVEAENEVLLKKINKLTFANSRLRSFHQSSTQRSFEQMNQQPASAEQSATNTGEGKQQDNDNEEDGTGVACDLIEQNEQLKLALELTQSESDRLKAKLQQLNEQLELKDNALREIESKRIKLEQDFSRFKALRRATSFGAPMIDDTTSGGANSLLELKASSEQINKLEYECRQLRSKLVHSERECKQLKSRLEQVIEQTSGRKSRQSSMNLESRQLSNEGSFENQRHLVEQVEQWKMKSSELEEKLKRLTGGTESRETFPGGHNIESDLLEKLKRQLDISENELAKSKSRLVELDLELNRIQRQYKRLVESLEGKIEMNQSNSSPVRKVKLPTESMRDSMSRQELRHALKGLDEEIEELLVTIRAKDCLIKELQETNKSTSVHSPSEEEIQVRSLHRLLDQEKLLSNNLKIDVKNLEKMRNELQLKNRMFERERIAMEEEMDKFRQVNQELNISLEDVRKNYRISSGRLKELQVDYEKLRIELLAATNSSNETKTVRTVDNQAMSAKDPVDQCLQDSARSPTTNGAPNSNEGERNRGTSDDLLLMARDLSELKVKNGFLMRQLEIVRDDTARQLDDLRQSNDDQTRRAVELAQIKLKEKHLIDLQHLRDEVNEVKQKLAASQRLVARNEEEVSSERDKLRSMERDWRRDKSNWQQRAEQLEAQLTIEKRSNEYKVKECESLMREKERELIGIQDKYVQLERDQKRLQNKYKLLEDNSETKEKNLMRDLEIKKRELSDLLAKSQAREDEYYENCKRFNGEKATLLEALESIKRSYDEKLVECKSVRELLIMRQDQAYKERLNLKEKIDNLNSQLIKFSELETQSKLLKQQIQMQDKQLESMKRECLQLKEEKLKFKTKCDDLEKRCNQYEKQELISKTSSISSSTNIFLKARNPFTSSQNSKQAAAAANKSKQADINDNGLELENSKKSTAQLIEKLTSKINDQRNLMNMLKQQHDEAQVELKQLKLINLADKSKWQIRINQLESQLADCEERLLMESSNLLSSETFDNSRKKMEIKWIDERSTMQDMIKQQQTQNELLMRDLKKITQSHDLLRLQSKQLESHNNKLSRKLIEYQQQKVTDPFAPHLTRRDSSTPTMAGAVDISRKLDDCLSSKRSLENHKEMLLRSNDKLMCIIREQVEPLIEIVRKIMAALESSNSKEKNRSFPTDETRSTQRPLITGPGPGPGPESISTAPAAHQGVSSSPSRLSRFLGTSSSKLQHQQVEKESPNIDGKASKQASTKTVKRVKIKSSVIGITPTEKKQLLQKLQELSVTLDSLSSAAYEDPGYTVNKQPKRASSELPERGRPLVLDRYKQRGSSHTPTRSVGTIQNLVPSSTTGTHSNHGNVDLDKQQRLSSNPYAIEDQASNQQQQQSRVHWQLDYASDCDSEKSWSQLDSGSGSTTIGSNYYKRFPQTMPSSYYKTNPSVSREQGVSLTDCDSESSLAPSDYSSYSSQRRFISGTESDSCMTTGASGKVSRSKSSRSKSSGLKLRLTSTLRNISRSISGLANTSDSEHETTATTKSLSKQQRRDLPSLKTELGNKFNHNNNEDNEEKEDDDDEENLDQVGSKLREIRV